MLLLQQRKRYNKEASVQGVDAGVRLRLPPASTPCTEGKYPMSIKTGHMSTESGNCLFIPDSV